MVFSIINGPEGDIAKLAGGSLTASYTRQNSEGPLPSPDTTVSISASTAVLPEPRVHEAPPPDYVFDSNQSTGDATIEVDPHSDIIEGIRSSCMLKAMCQVAARRPNPSLSQTLGKTGHCLSRLSASTSCSIKI